MTKSIKPKKKSKSRKHVGYSIKKNRIVKVYCKKSKKTGKLPKSCPKKQRVFSNNKSASRSRVYKKKSTVNKALKVKKPAKKSKAKRPAKKSKAKKSKAKKSKAKKSKAKRPAKKSKTKKSKAKRPAKKSKAKKSKAKKPKAKKSKAKKSKAKKSKAKKPKKVENDFDFDTLPFFNNTYNSNLDF